MRNSEKDHLYCTPFVPSIQKSCIAAFVLPSTLLDGSTITCNEQPIAACNLKHAASCEARFTAVTAICYRGKRTGATNANLHILQHHRERPEGLETETLFGLQGDRYLSSSYSSPVFPICQIMRRVAMQEVAQKFSTDPTKLMDTCQSKATHKPIRTPIVTMFQLLDIEMYRSLEEIHILQMKSESTTEWCPSFQGEQFKEQGHRSVFSERPFPENMLLNSWLKNDNY